MEFKDQNWGLWLVVKPTVGLPLFFIAIALTSLAIHLAILTHTTWFGSYWQGHTRTYSSSQIDAPTTPAHPALASN